MSCAAKRATMAALLAALAASLAAGSNPASIFTRDKGTFRILVNGQQAGHEDFEIAPSGSDWIAHGHAEIQAGQGVTQVTGTLELHADGTPVRYEWSTEGAKQASGVITFDGPTVSTELHVGDKLPYTQQFKFNSPQIAILDNNLYDQYAVLARLYDWDKKGTQTFSVLVPQSLTPGTVTVDSLGKQEVGGKELDELRVKTEDLELDLYLDGPRLERIVAPASNAEILRD
ncbi:MAG: hypothetical protein WA175_04570 [Candidatus Acidiferrales bacterium]